MTTPPPAALTPGMRRTLLGTAQTYLIAAHGILSAELSRVDSEPGAFDPWLLEAGEAALKARNELAQSLRESYSR